MSWGESMSTDSARNCPGVVLTAISRQPPDRWCPEIRGTERSSCCVLYKRQIFHFAFCGLDSLPSLSFYRGKRIPHAGVFLFSLHSHSVRAVCSVTRSHPQDASPRVSKCWVRFKSKLPSICQPQGSGASRGCRAGWGKGHRGRMSMRLQRNLPSNCCVYCSRLSFDLPGVQPYNKYSSCV